MFQKYLPLLSLFVSAQVFATEEIKTASQAEKFLNQYCIELVNEVSRAVDRQRNHAAKEDWEGLLREGSYISGIAEIFDNLCERPLDDR